MLLRQKTIVAVRSGARSGFSCLDTFHGYSRLRHTILLAKCLLIGRDDLWSVLIFYASGGVTAICLNDAFRYFSMVYSTCNKSLTHFFWIRRLISLTVRH